MNISKPWYRALREANKRLEAKGKEEIKTGFRFHDLRHTFGSQAMARGVDLVTVKELMGHSDIKMTQRYLHSDDRRKRAAIDRLWEKKSKDGQKTESELVGFSEE